MRASIIQIVTRRRSILNIITYIVYYYCLFGYGVLLQNIYVYVHIVQNESIYR